MSFKILTNVKLHTLSNPGIKILIMRRKRNREDYATTKAL